MSKLFIVEGNQTKVLDQKAFDNEALLQDVVERFPEVIAQDDLGVTEPFLVIGREVATKAGYIDVLCIDGDGVLSVIETKLARNSQIRREVVGQVLEYVAQLSKWRAHDVVQSANQYFASTGVKVGERTATIFDLLVTEQEEEPGSLPMDLYDKIENNLRKGIIKLVIASDSIPETLKDTVTFINSFSNFDIYVLQIQSYQKDQLQIYAPTVFGFTHKPAGGVTTDKIQWDEESFFKSLSNLRPEAVQTIQKLYSFTKENAAGIQWGTGRSSSSFSYTVDSVKKKFNIFAVLNQGDTGRILINFGSMKGVIPNEELHAFRESLNKLPEVELPVFMVDEGKYPSIPVKSVIKDEDFESFTNEVLRLQALVKESKENES